MARPRSEDKQNALLEAATAVIAEHGLGAPTALIAKRAGVAEGTLFRYFPTKDDLLNELYVDIKRSLMESNRDRFLPAAARDELMHSLWDGYINWGIANPAAVKALSQLAVSDKITPQTRARVAALFPEVHHVSGTCLASGALAALPREFGDTIFMSLADTTMQFATRNPDHAEAYKAAGFEVFWKSLAQ